MADKIFQIATNGQQLQQADVNLLGETSGLAQDHVFAELLRMTPYNGSTVSKGILPPTSSALIAANGASGSVVVNAFRAFVGSRIAEATEALDNRQDIRSALSVAEGATNDQTTVVLAANATGNPRWDLIYAAVAVDANSPTVSRKVKDTATAVVSSTSVVLTKVQTLTIGVVAGTAGATPAFPTIPADAGSTYYIPLGYVRVPNGFGASSTVSPRNINIAATCLSLSSPALGSSATRPASSISTIGGAGVIGAGTTTNNGVNSWLGTDQTRPAAYLPPTMSGSETLLIALDLENASSANWSHQNGDVVDNSRDWRNRIFKATCVIGRGSSTMFPWFDSTAVGMPGSESFHSKAYDANTGVIVHGVGHSFGQYIPIVGFVSGGPDPEEAGLGYNVPTNAMANSTVVAINIDYATGDLKVNITGVPRCAVFIWLEASGQFHNF